MSNLENHLVELRRLYTQLDDDPDSADLIVAQTNAAINDLKEIGFLTSRAEFADTSPSQGDDPHRFTQASLLIPEGFGVCIWDREAYFLYEGSPDGIEPHAASVFKPFEKCTAAEKSLVLPFVVQILEDLIHLIILNPDRRDRKQKRCLAKISRNVT